MWGGKLPSEPRLCETRQTPGKPTAVCHHTQPRSTPCTRCLPSAVEIRVSVSLELYMPLYTDSQAWRNTSWVIHSSRPNHKDYFLTWFSLLSYPIQSRPPMSVHLLYFDSLFQARSRLWILFLMSSLTFFPFLILGQTLLSHFLDNPDNSLPFFHAVSFTYLYCYHHVITPQTNFFRELLADTLSTAAYSYSSQLLF